MADVNDWNTKIIEEFRTHEGKVGGPFEGAPIVLLSTTGAKSGLTRVNPMMYLADGGRTFVFASKAGHPTNPDWYFNLKANPDVVVEIGTDKYNAVATEVIGPERDEIFARQKALYPGFAEYEAKTDRVIPVIELVKA